MPTALTLLPMTKILVPKYRFYVEEFKDSGWEFGCKNLCMPEGVLGLWPSPNFKLELDLAFNNVKPKDRYFVLD